MATRKESVYSFILTFIVIFVSNGFAQNQIQLQYGSAFDNGNSVLSLFTDEAQTGFDSTTQGLLAFGFFDDAYDVNNIVKGSFGQNELVDLVTNFNVLFESSFDTASPSGFIDVTGSPTEAGVGKTGYLLSLAGVTQFSSASSATEIGLFTDATAIGTIPAGADPPVDTYFTNSVTYDIQYLGTEHAGTDMSTLFGAGWTANQYATQAVPEPSTYALLLGAASFGFVYYRRKVASKKGQQATSESETVA